MLPLPVGLPGGANVALGDVEIAALEFDPALGVPHVIEQVGDVRCPAGAGCRD